MNDKPVLVIAGIIRKGNLTLIAQRKSDSFLGNDKWEFPGGKVEFLERPENCLVREIKEELDIEIAVESLFSVESHIYEKKGKKYHIILVIYLAKYLRGDTKPVDCQDYAWIKKTDFSKYDFVAADIPIIEKYIHNI